MICLSGIYSRLNQSSFTNGDVELILCNRKAKGKKPSQYLMINQAGKKQYLSSLYPSGQGHYTIEYECKYYKVKWSELYLNIEAFAYKKAGKIPQYNNKWYLLKAVSQSLSGRAFQKKSSFADFKVKNVRA